MRLFELDPNFEPRTLKAKDFRGKDPTKLPPGLEYLGSGIATTVYQKKSKPHEVKKITYRVRNIEGNYLIEYLKACIKHQDNPFLPRIYEVKVFKRNIVGPKDEPPPTPSYAVYVESEKLVEASSLNWGQISQLFRFILGMSVQEAFAAIGKEPRGSSRVTNDPADKDDALNILAGAFKEELNVAGDFRGSSYYRDYGIKLQNKLAIKAIHDISSIKKDVPGIWNDLGISNMMFRVTPYGIWPVLTDPFHQSR